MIKFKDKRKQDNFMLYIPKKKHINWEKDENRVKLLFYHDSKVEMLIRWLFKKPRVSDITLDEIGSTTWELIDGRNNVYELNQMLFEKYGECCNLSNNSLVMFLRYLNRRGWVSFEKEKLE